MCIDKPRLSIGDCNTDSPIVKNRKKHFLNFLIQIEIIISFYVLIKDTTGWTLPEKQNKRHKSTSYDKYITA